MSRKRILIFTTALLLSCSFAMGIKRPNINISTYLKPWCTIKAKEIGISETKITSNLEAKIMADIKEAFSDDEDAAYNFIVEFTSASNASFNNKDVKASCVIQTKVLLGLIFLADSVCKDNESKRAKLLYRIQDAIEMFEEMPLKGRLTNPEKTYFEQLSEEEIESSFTESEDENENINDEEDSDMKAKN
jgi:hypothetical protein